MCVCLCDELHSTFVQDLLSREQRNQDTIEEERAVMLKSTEVNSTILTLFTMKLTPLCSPGEDH